MHIIAILAVLFLAPFTDAIAQEPLTPGQRVRVTVPSLDLNKHQDTFQRMSGDTLVLESASYSLSEVTRLDVYAGRRSNARRGVLIGGLSGIGIGLTASIVWMAKDCEFFDSYECHGHDLAFMGAGTLVLGLIGSGIGAVIGTSIRTDKWEEVALDRLQVSIAPTRNGFGVGARIAF